IPVVLLAMQAWRAIAYSALFASLFVATTIVLFGFEPWKFFVEITLPNQMQIMNMTSFNAVLMSSPYFMLRGFGVSASVSYHLQILIAVAAMAWLYAGLRCERDRNLQIVMVACATLLASAYMRTYEIPLLAAAVARICASEAGAARYGRGLLRGLIISVTAAPLIAWLAALVFKINVMSLIPLVVLAILGVRAIFQDAPIAKLSAVVGRDGSENRALSENRYDRGALSCRRANFIFRQLVLSHRSAISLFRGAHAQMACDRHRVRSPTRSQAWQ
ncbi:MAG: glycosyltransferase 87 family protein, partial [Hyphomicrobium sp.]